MVKTGSMNMAKAIRRIGHRSGQARKMTFVRDAITGKDNYGGEITEIATGNEGLTIPNIDAFIAPIITKTDTFNKAGHLVTGSATLYVPSLSTIKNNILGIDADGIHTARLSSFNEMESKDKLFDMEKIVFSADSDETSDGDAVETYTITTNTAGFEIDRLQFKVTDEDTSDTNRITTIVITDSLKNFLTWTFDSSINFDNNKYHTIDLPLSNVDASEKAYCIYVPSSGASGIRTATATFGFTDATCDYNNDPTIIHNANASIVAGLAVSGTGIPAGATIASVAGDGLSFELSAATTGGEVINGTLTFGGDFDIKNVDGESTTLTTVVITSNATGMSTKDFRLYKAGEWNIKNIKEYRDEYMELGCDKIRGERGSRRRATVINVDQGPYPAEDAY